MITVLGVSLSLEIIVWPSMRTLIEFLSYSIPWREVTASIRENKILRTVNEIARRTLPVLRTIINL